MPFAKMSVLSRFSGSQTPQNVAAQYRVPIVITGFEPVDLLQGILLAVRQLEAGRAEVENAYARVVGDAGNGSARAMVNDVFEVCNRKWRGIGIVSRSGLRLRDEYRDHDAGRIFELDTLETRESELCISGDILKGQRKPRECPAFGKQCTPESPLGATMVSSEGACAAYYAYGRHLEAKEIR